MADYNKFKQLKAFARVDGAYMGLLWIIAFTFFVLQYSDPLMGLVCMFVSVFSLFFAYKRMVKFRVEVFEDSLSFGTAYLYALFVFFYASILMGLAQYIYFKFIDGGFIVGSYEALLTSKEFAAASKAYGISPEDMKEAMNQLSSVRPVDIAFNFLSMNIFGSFFLSLPLALFAKKTKNKY